MITLRQIESFKAIMEAGTVHKAAEVMCLSQPAVSRLLSDLEANLGYSLFERRKGRVVARREAQELYGEVERSFVGLGRIAEAAERIGHRCRTRLRVAVLPALSMGPLPDVVTRLLADNPGLFISLENRSRSQVLEGLAEGRYDIGLASAPIQTPGVEMTPLLRSGVKCLVPAHHPLARRKVLTPQDLHGVSVILGSEQTPLRLKLDRMLREAGVQFERRVEVSSLQMACALIARGVGVAFFVRWLLPDPPLEGIRVIPFRPEMFLDFAALFPAGRPPDGIAARFVQDCAKAARQIELA